MTKKLKLKVYFILIAAFNAVYSIAFPFSIRRFLLWATGCKIGKDSGIQKVRFFSFGKLKVGKNSIINSGCYLDNRRGITIGNNVVIAHNTKIYTLGHDINDTTFKTKGAPVVIEDFVVVFSNVLIMPGVTIKKGAVILPGSVVTRDIEEMAVVGGNPAKAVKQRETLHTDKENYLYWFAL